MFKPQLSEDRNECKEAITFPKAFSYKLDGLRAVTKFGDTLSRSLKPIPNEYIRNKLRDYQDLDGEIIVGNLLAPDVRRRTSSEVRSYDGEPNFTYYVFDDLSNLQLPFEKRLDRLHQRILPDFIVVLDQSIINSQEDLDTFYQHALDEGHEGLIGRNLQSMYKFGRCTAKSQDSLKFKPFKDDEARILEVYEAMHNENEAFTNELGRTARSTHQENLVGKGMAGGFVVEDLKTHVVFRVSAGVLKHPERVWAWNHREQLKSAIITYRHFESGAKDKPQFGRFYAFRDSFDMSV